MRPVTEEEQARLLTQVQVDVLVDGTPILVWWGRPALENWGPFEYVVAHEREQVGAYHAFSNGWGALFNVGTDKAHQRVLLR